MKSPEYEIKMVHNTLELVKEKYFVTSGSGSTTSGCSRTILLRSKRNKKREISFIALSKFGWG